MEIKRDTIHSAPGNVREYMSTVKSHAIEDTGGGTPYHKWVDLRITMLPTSAHLYCSFTKIIINTEQVLPLLESIEDIFQDQLQIKYRMVGNYPDYSSYKPKEAKVIDTEEFLDLLRSKL